MDGLVEASEALVSAGSDGVAEIASIRLEPRRSAPIILSLRHLSVAYGERAVLKNADCSFPQGEISAILGPSGCGKSTLLRVLNPLLSGAVAFHGKDINERGTQPMLIRRRIGLIHQRPVPFPMSILDDVLFASATMACLAARRPWSMRTII